MARPQKEGIDYFSVNCQFNDQVKLIQAEFGLIGLGILVRLWQKIYGGKGYYTAWDDDVAMMFASECSVGVSVVKEVISACLRRGLFDRQKYEQYQILTSEGIQERYAEATERRVSQKIDGRYLLIAMPKNWVNVDNNSINVSRNSKKGDNNSQRKEEESKEDSFNHSFAREKQETHEDEDLEDIDLEDIEVQRKYLGGIGKDVVLLNDVQMTDLLSQMSLDEFHYYVGVVADCELRGKHYKNKSHYQAILDMAKKDRKILSNKTGGTQKCVN